MLISYKTIGRNIRAARKALALTQEQALSAVSPKLDVQGARLCVIPYRDGESLCWEVTGMWDDNEYRVYVDAHTGEEKQVLMMVRDAYGQMAA